MIYKMPSNENKLKPSLVDEVFSFSIKLEKEIVWLKMFFPSKQTKFVISEAVESIEEHIEKELRTNSPITIVLIKNLAEFSTSCPL